MSVFNAQLIRMVEQNLYALKRQYGGPVIFCSLLEADTESAKYASSHANAANALEASRAAGALTVIEKRLAAANGEQAAAD